MNTKGWSRVVGVVLGEGMCMWGGGVGVSGGCVFAGGISGLVKQDQ